MPHFMSDPTFWVAVSFFLFIAMIWKPLGRFIATALDTRSEKISKELREAVALREEAQSLLAEYQKKQRENMEEASRIVSQTKADAQAMAERAEQELRDTLEKRKAMAMERIRQAEIAAVRMVQQNVADIAISASKQAIEEYATTGKNQDELLKKALSSVEEKLHS